MGDWDGFDDLAKAAASGMTRRSAFVRVANALGGLLLGTFGLRPSPKHATDPPAMVPRLPDTMRDGTFKCASVKGAMHVEGEYDVCLYRVNCVSTRGAPTRTYMATCKAKSGKCDRWDVCGDPPLQKNIPVHQRDARLAEVGPDDRRPTDKYGRKCRYDSAVPRALFLNDDKDLVGFCAAPIECTGGDADAPDLGFAVCEPTEVNDEPGKDFPIFTCPRVNLCINHPIKSSKAKVIDADK